MWQLECLSKLHISWLGMKDFSTVYFFEKDGRLLSKSNSKQLVHTKNTGLSPMNLSGTIWWSLCHLLNWIFIHRSILLMWLPNMSRDTRRVPGPQWTAALRKYTSSIELEKQMNHESHSLTIIISSLLMKITNSLASL